MTIKPLVLFLAFLLALASCAPAPPMELSGGFASTQEINLYELRGFMQEAKAAGRIDELVQSLETQQNINTLERDFARAYLVVLDEDYGESARLLAPLASSRRESAVILLTYAQTLSNLGRHEEARAELQLAFERSSAPRLRSEILLGRALVEKALGNAGEAESFLLRSITGYAEPAVVDDALRQFYGIWGRRRRGFLIRLLDQKEPDPVTRAWVLMRMGFAEAALEALRSAPPAGEWDAQKRLELAEAAYRTAWTRSISHGENAVRLMMRALPVELQTPEVAAAVRCLAGTETPGAGPDRALLEPAVRWIENDGSERALLLHARIFAALPASNLRGREELLGLAVRFSAAESFSTEEERLAAQELGAYYLARAVRAASAQSLMESAGEAKRALVLLNRVALPEAAVLRGCARYLSARAESSLSGSAAVKEELERARGDYAAALAARPFRMEIRRAFAYLSRELSAD